MTKEAEASILNSAPAGRQAENKPSVSVIVPVYNVEPYLRRCTEYFAHKRPLARRNKATVSEF